MPWGDQTGPLGYGPMSGRAAGYCAGYPVPGYLNRGWGGGPGRGWGRGRGFGRGLGGGRWARWGNFPPGVFGPYDPAGGFIPANPKHERAFLEEQVKVLQDQLEHIQQRLDQLVEPDQPRE